MKDRLKKVEDTIELIVVQMANCLELLGSSKKSSGNNLTKLQVFSEALRLRVYEVRREIKHKESLRPSKYPDYPFQNIQDGYVYLYREDGINMRAEHRYLVEQKIGRRLKRSEIVHHEDENRSNNNLNNLQIVSAGEHLALHRKARKRRENAK